MYKDKSKLISCYGVVGLKVAQLQCLRKKSVLMVKIAPNQCGKINNAL